MHTEVEFSSEIGAGSDRRLGAKNEATGDRAAGLTPERNRRHRDGCSGKENGGEFEEHIELSGRGIQRVKAGRRSAEMKRNFAGLLKGSSTWRDVPAHSNHRAPK